ADRAPSLPRASIAGSASADSSSRAIAESAAITAGAFVPTSPSTTAAAMRLRGSCSERSATIFAVGSIAAIVALQSPRAPAAAPHRRPRTLPVPLRAGLDHRDALDDRREPARAGDAPGAWLAAVRSHLFPARLHRLPRMRFGAGAGGGVPALGQPEARAQAHRPSAPERRPAGFRPRAARALPPLAPRPRAGTRLEARRHRRRIVRDAVLLSPPGS